MILDTNPGNRCYGVKGRPACDEQDAGHQSARRVVRARWNVESLDGLVEEDRRRVPVRAGRESELAHQLCELLRAGEAGALNGDPRRPYLLLEAPKGNGFTSHWPTILSEQRSDRAHGRERGVPTDTAIGVNAGRSVQVGRKSISARQVVLDQQDRHDALRKSAKRLRAARPVALPTQRHFMRGAVLTRLVHSAVHSAGRPCPRESRNAYNERPSGPLVYR